MTSCLIDAGQQAGRLLQAWREGDAAKVRPELDRMKAHDEAMAREPAAEAERWELLESIAERLHDCLEPNGKGAAPAGEAVEVYLRLLEHLATRFLTLTPARSLR